MVLAEKDDGTVWQKIRDGINVAFMFLLIAFIAASLFRLGVFFLQGNP